MFKLRITGWTAPRCGPNPDTRWPASVGGFGAFDFAGDQFDLGLKEGLEFTAPQAGGDFLTCKAQGRNGVAVIEQ